MIYSLSSTCSHIVSRLAALERHLDHPCLPLEAILQLYKSLCMKFRGTFPTQHSNGHGRLNDIQLTSLHERGLEPDEQKERVR
jgi:hypothetical protein